MAAGLGQVRCQFDRIENHLRDRPLHMPVGDYFDLSEHVKTFANCGQLYLWGGDTTPVEAIQTQTLLSEGGTALLQGGRAVFYLVEHCWRPGLELR